MRFAFIAKHRGIWPVAWARCLAKRLPCLAHPGAVAACPRRRGDRCEGPCQPCRKLSHLWCPPCLARPACRRHLLRPAPGRTAYAGAGAAGSSSASRATQGSRRTLGHRRQRARSPVHGRQAQPEVGGGLHLHLDCRGVVLRSRRHRPVLASGGRLVDERHHDGPARHRRAGATRWSAGRGGRCEYIVTRTFIGAWRPPHLQATRSPQ